MEHSSLPSPSSSNFSTDIPSSPKKKYKRRKKYWRKKARTPRVVKRKKPKKRGAKIDRPILSTATERFVPLQFAKMIVQALGIKSIKEYDKWYKDNNIRYLPFNPRKTYKEWESWNDFLGTDNSFERNFETKKKMKEEYLPYWEGVKVGQKVGKEGVNSARLWRKYHKEKGLVGVPRYPERHYKDWSGWEVWLGKTLGAEVEVLKRMEQYLLIIDEGGGYYSFWVTKGGREEAIQVLSGKKLVKAYVWEEERASEVDGIIRNSSEDFEEKTRYCINVNSIIYQLDTIILTYRG